ncbi:MAG TPA: Nif3-like dinuclear metal center hexameric protein [Bacteroidota bacterium]|nr:Nif3-like dinuclear metal center hexameric protein [Bacteroidota bacterium]
MTVRGIQEIMEAWAPLDIAWERDNPGLQAGDPGRRVRGILVALDVTEPVVAEAAGAGADLIVSHHPLLFRPLRSLTTRSGAERTLAALARRGIALYSAHTNLDFTRGGTSFALAGALGLHTEGFLSATFRTDCKVVTFVPPSHADSVSAAMAEAGGGVIGAYDHCSFRSAGRGTFRGGKETHPAIGRAGVLEHTEEIRLEMVVPRRALGTVTDALKRAHPYEEVAYDVYPLETHSTAYGMGALGTLPRPVPLAAFLAGVRKSLGTRALRWSGDPRSRVQRVAVCGGGGSDLLRDAIAAGADAFVTADVRYHTFHDAGREIALVDAGHFETEFPVVAAIVGRLKSELRARGERVPVRASSRATNPVRVSM